MKQDNVSNGLSHEAYLGLGSNLGDRVTNLRRGVASLENSGAIQVIRASSLYESKPVGCEGGEFLNAVVHIRTTLTPEGLLRAAKMAEEELGRLGSGQDARTLDVDILYYNSLVTSSRELTIPHARRLDRSFVVTPLAEICENKIDPATGRKIYVEVGLRLTPSLGQVKRVSDNRWLSRNHRQSSSLS